MKHLKVIERTTQKWVDKDLFGGSMPNNSLFMNNARHVRVIVFLYCYRIWYKEV